MTDRAAGTVHQSSGEDGIRFQENPEKNQGLTEGWHGIRHSSQKKTASEGDFSVSVEWDQPCPAGPDQIEAGR